MQVQRPRAYLKLVLRSGATLALHFSLLQGLRVWLDFAIPSRFPGGLLAPPLQSRSSIIAAGLLHFPRGHLGLRPLGSAAAACCTTGPGVPYRSSASRECFAAYLQRACQEPFEALHRHSLSRFKSGVAVCSAGHPVGACRLRCIWTQHRNALRAIQPALQLGAVPGNLTTCLRPVGAAGSRW